MWNNGNDNENDNENDNDNNNVYSFFIEFFIPFVEFSGVKTERLKRKTQFFRNVDG